MTMYRVTIDLNSISYEIEAENEDKAVDIAKDCFYEESLHDIEKWADYSAEEVGE